MCSILLFACILSIFAVQSDEIEVVAFKLTDDALVLEETRWQGHITAINTNEGLVLIDTLNSPLAGKKARNLIKEEFGQQPIRYVIITHFHGDHVYGHQHFSEATTIAHTDCTEKKKEYNKYAIEWDSTLDKEILSLEHHLKAAASESEETRKLKAELDWNRYLKTHFNGFVPTYFDIFIDSSAVLSFSDKTIKIMHFGPCHTSSDLVVLIPEERVLVTGDIVFHHFIPHIEAKWGGDVPNTIATLENLIQMADEFDHVVPGHGNVGDIQALKDQRDYLNDLWNAVESARKRGLTLEQAKAEIKLEKYSHYGTYVVAPIAGNVEACWKMMDQKEK